MSSPYLISANISREKARELIERLADDPEFRERFEKEAREVLQEYEIHVTPETLPEQVSLPDPDAIREFLSFTETRIMSETASPFGLLLLVIVFGAMPVLAGDRRPLDGTG